MVDKLSKLLLIISIVAFTMSSQTRAETFEHTLSPGWNFISLPFTPTSAAPSTLLGLFDSANAPKIDGARTLGIEAGAYADAQSIQAHFHGRGYLIYSPGAYKLRLQGAETPAASPVTVPLKKGWNLIGSPYNSEVSWDSDISIDGVPLTLAADKVDPRLFSYDPAGGSFTPASAFETKLQPWKAYFIKAKQDCSLTFAAKGQAARGSIISVNIDGSGAQKAVAGEVVVSLEEGADPAAAIAKIQALGGVVTKSNPGAGLYLASIPLSADSSEFSNSVLSAAGVDSALPNIILSSADLVPNDPPYAPSADPSLRWAFEKINAPRAWAAATYAAQPLIAVIDTGVDASSPDLSGRLLEGKSFTGMSPASDPSGHGTRIAGIIAAAGDNGSGIAGVCWQCRILPAQACDASGDCPIFSVLDSLAHSTEQGAKIINISLSAYAPAGSLARKIFQASVNRAAAGGALIVAAAGNNSSDAGGYIPGGLDNVLTVTASNQADGRPSFANYGTSVDIAAPGENIYTLQPSGGAGFTNGTSAAAAFVSGAVGLLMSQNPGLTPDNAAATLLSTAAPAAFSPAITGGRLDIGAALDPPAPVNRAPVISGCALTPGAVPHDGTSGASLSCDITDPENNIASVAVDLSAIGGGTPANLFNSGGAAWTISNITPAPATPPGDYQITITATDSSGASAASLATLKVSPPPNRVPFVSGCDFLPHGLAPGSSTPSSVTVYVSDSDGPEDISSVSIDLTQIGGGPAELLYDDGYHGDGGAADGVYGLDGITIPAGNPQGVFELPVSAIDAASGVGNNSCLVAINATLAPQAACTTSWPRFHCNSEASGEATGHIITAPVAINWTYTTNDAIYSSPAIDAASGRLFIANGLAGADNNLHIINANTGALIQNCAMSGSSVSSPAFSNNKVYVGGLDSAVYAFNALDCSAGWLWKTAIGGVTYSSPLVYGGLVFIGADNNAIYAFDENTGAIAWSTNTLAGQVRSIPAGDAGNIYFAGGSRIYALTAAAGTQVWSTAASNTISASPAIASGRVFIGDQSGGLYALDANTGAILWKYAAGSNLYSSPAVANGNVYIVNNSGVAYALNQITGAVVWTRNMGGGTVIASPVVVDGKVIFTQVSTTNIVILKESDGSILQNKNLFSSISASPAIYNNKIYLGGWDKKVYCLAANVPPVVGAISFSVNPLVADAYATTTITAVVSDSNGLTDISAVTINLSLLGGSASTTLYDNATNGDVTAGDGIYSRSNITAATSTTAGLKSLTVTAVDIGASTGTAAGALTITANTAPVITTCSFAPASIIANGVASAVLTCTGVSDVDNNLQSVRVNLSAIGGSASAALTSAGAGTWQRAAVTASIGTASNTYTITTTATDIAGATTTKTAPLIVTAPNTAPSVSAVTFTPSSVTADGLTSFTVTATVSDANGLADVATVSINLTTIGGSAAALMYDDGAHGDGAAGNGVYGLSSTVASGTASNPYTLTVTATDLAATTGSANGSLTVTAPNNPPVISTCVFTPNPATADASTPVGLRCLVSDPEANVSTVSANLSAISGSSSAAMSSIGSGFFETASFTVSVAVASGTYTISVYATDTGGATGTATASLVVNALVVNFAPAVSNVTFSPSSVIADGVTSFTATATVSDANGLSDVATVTINLSSIGGSAAALMYDDGAHGDGAAADGVFGLSSTVASGTAMGSYTLGVTAYDAAAASGSASGTLAVTIPNNPPVISSCSFTPNPVSANGSTPVGLRCLVSDPEANVSTVTADLSLIGGSAAEAMPAVGAGYFETASFTVPLGTTPATYTITINATDTVGATGTASSALGVTSVNPWFIQACGGQPDGHWLPLNNPGMVNMPRDAAVSDNDDIYIADTGNHRVAQFDKNCVFIRNWGYLGNANGNFKTPTGIAFNAANNYIYVADYYDRVQRFSKTGAYVDTINVAKPTSIEIDSSGNLYVTSKTSNLLSKFDPSGTLTATWTVTAPHGIDLDASGNIYMTLPASSVIMKLDPSSGATSTIGSPGSGNAQFSDPRGIAVDSASGVIYIADYGNNRVQEITLSGLFVQEFNQYGAGPGQVNYPEGVALANTNNLLLLDTLNSRLQEFQTY